MPDANDMHKQLISEFADNYLEKLFFFCLKRTGNQCEAEDLTQDIALCVISALNGRTIPMHFSAWVWQIARNRYSVWAERKHKRNLMMTDIEQCDSQLNDNCADISDMVIYNDQLALLRRELAFIKREYRDIVVAYYIENKSIRDIASSLSLPENTVKSKLFRAREILKEGMNMAREFGKLSYAPENISFIVNGLYGSNGEPWNLISRSLCKNILLAAYRNPSTVEELAMEIGVALPYMEEEVASLVNTEVMKKNGNRYETNFFIVSGEAQENIFAHLRSIAPELTKAVISALEYELEWKNSNCPGWHGGYQPIEDMKWAMLMYQTDVINFDTLEAFNKTREHMPKANLGSWGHTIRPGGGEWDLLGMEKHHGDEPAYVGLHGCVTSPAEKDLPQIGFQQFKFKYRNIEDKTPGSMPYLYAQALVSIAKGNTADADGAIHDYLEEHGYIIKVDSVYKPTFLVIYRDKLKPMPSEELAELERLRHTAAEIAMRHYLFCREQIMNEIPGFLKNDEYQIDHACANIFAMRGAVLEEALRIGYITYSENDNRRMLGTFLRI